VITTPLSVLPEVSIRLAMYKCEACGKEASSAGMCCGSQMKQVS